MAAVDEKGKTSSQPQFFDRGIISQDQDSSITDSLRLAYALVPKELFDQRLSTCRLVQVAGTEASVVVAAVAVNSGKLDGGHAAHDDGQDLVYRNLKKGVLELL